MRIPAVGKSVGVAPANGSEPTTEEELAEDYHLVAPEPGAIDALAEGVLFQAPCPTEASSNSSTSSPGARSRRIPCDTKGPGTLSSGEGPRGSQRDVDLPGCLPHRVHRPRRRYRDYRVLPASRKRRPASEDPLLRRLARTGSRWRLLST